jgi:hypothetical protein
LLYIVARVKFNTIYLYISVTISINMTNNTNKNKEMVLAGPTDHKRIAPMKLPDSVTKIAKSTGTAAPASGRLVYNGGLILESVKVYTIFLGNFWEQSPGIAPNQINSFFTDILTSPLMDQLEQYNTNGYTIGHGSLIGTSTITNVTIGSTITDGQIQHILEQAIVDHTVPVPDQQTLYFLYIPEGVKVSAFGSGSCTSFCGYHDCFNTNPTIYYAVMPYPSCDGCVGGLQPFDALTSTSSHELVEAITDPVPGQGFYDNGDNEEIGDLCAWKTKKVGNYTVQLEWSNTDNACV